MKGSGNDSGDYVLCLACEISRIRVTALREAKRQSTEKRNGESSRQTGQLPLVYN
jgi:hypothetical protein